MFCGQTDQVKNSEPFVISAEAGEAVNLTCTFVDNSIKEVRMWYKQRLEHAPLEVGSQLEGKSAVISDQFDRSRFKLNRTASGISLSIERVTKEDEGMYFCGATGKKTLEFSTATFLAVTGKIFIYWQLNTSVLQTAVQWSVSPGESVTLQCTVMSEIRAADLRVLWFRAAAGQSFPEIIYTHQNSSSRQCEIISSTSCSLYEFSKNILDQHHTGTYYCAVVVCGKIIFGNGTSVELSKCSCVLLGTCSIFVLFMCNSINTLGFKASSQCYVSTSKEKIENVTETGFLGKPIFEFLTSS
uniref:Ig-like domain-containing protein n=1 Tax=Pygocentrus nattereri TaxID=42514 RepID=A0A3B4EC05_PYGNA